MILEVTMVVKVMAAMKRGMTRVGTTMVVRSVLVLVGMVCTATMALLTVVMGCSVWVARNKCFKDYSPRPFFALDIHTAFFDSYLSLHCSESSASSSHQQYYCKPVNRARNPGLYSSHDDHFHCSRLAKHCAYNICNKSTGINKWEAF